MTKIVILGCGYVGRVLARRLIDKGNPVRATTTTEAKLTSLTALGADPVVLRPDQPSTFRAAMEDAEAVIHLAPPSEKALIEMQVKMIADACSSQLKVYLYGSTTGVFGRTEDPNMWVDESTPPRNLSERAQRRLDFERALAQAGLPVRVARIAGIYGPGRTLRHSLQSQGLILFEGGPYTSRIHVEDLARLLEAMLEPEAPPLAIACDEEPAPTLEVARYTAGLLGIEAPEPVPIEDAKRVLSPSGLEMRLGGHRCRSLVRERLIGALTYPTYREGVVASLEAEGALTPKST